MKTARLRSLQIWTIIVLILCCLLVPFSVYTVIMHTPSKLMLEASRDRQLQIQRDDVQNLRSDMRLALDDLDTFRRGEIHLLLFFVAAGAGIVGFQIWSLYVIRRIKKEDVSDHAA